MFSIVITTKNRLAYLKRCVDSILSSSVRPKEIVIVNDAGEIFSRNIFDCFDINITIINNCISKGANYCRNIGVECCNSEIIFLIDDDDAVTKLSFESRLSFFLEDKSVGLCFTGMQVMKSKNLFEPIRSVLPYSSSNYLYDLFDKGNVIGSTSRVAIRKSYFYLAGRFDENLQCLQDYDLWIRMARVCKIVNDGKSNLYYTVHVNGNQISSKYEKYIDASNYLISKYKSELNDIYLKKSFESNLHLRVALSATSSSTFYKIKHSAISFLKKPNIKSLVILLIPYFLLKRIYVFA